MGFAATAMALLHTFAALVALGSPAAIRGGMTALMPATAAVFLLFAHVGVGLRLRNPGLRARIKTRRWHVILALMIATTVVVHVTVLRSARSLEAFAFRAHPGDVNRRAGGGRRDVDADSRTTLRVGVRSVTGSFRPCRHQLLRDCKRVGSARIGGSGAYRWREPP
jgi:hypothetical protein